MVKARSLSKEVEDELSSMRGTKDTGSIAYLERKEIRGVSSVKEEPWIEHRSTASVIKEDIAASGRVSRDVSPPRSVPPTKRQGAKLASDKGIT